MAYETPITIKEAIEQIQKKKYVLPSIQREFVWESSQIEILFDSLMRDYPINTFLFWSVDKSKINEYQFYEFLQHFHERDNYHNPKTSLADDEDIIAVLDGQQRLTSIYIALKGTYAEKLRYYSWDKSHSFPKRKLYLDLLNKSEDIEKEFAFEFMTEDEIMNTTKAYFWFEVSKVLEFKEIADAMRFLMNNGLMDNSQYSRDKSDYAFNTLNNLYNVVHQKGTINYFLEKSSDLDKVLQIFIRTNSGGTKLSYSDLLLSIATAQWEENNAREVINEFVDEINKYGQGFNFNKDFVLKASLVLGDFSDIKFKVENFTKANMLKIENAWDSIAQAIRITVKLVSRFGFNRETLTSHNTLIPIAYYLLKINAEDSFIHQTKYEEQRENIRLWLLRVLLKRTFSGTPDNLYPQLRKLINEAGDRFPLQEIIEAFKGTPKSILFSEDDINTLCELEYGSKFSFAALALTYPEFNLNYTFHMDHIFPRKDFYEKRLKKKGITEEDIEFYLNNFNYLPNIQILEGNENKQKSSSDFNQWLNANYSSESSKASFLTIHHIPQDISLELSNFRDFTTTRTELLKIKFREILGLKEVPKSIS